MSSKPATIDHYIAAAAPEARDILQQIRTTVTRLVPDASETISYRMPAFRRKRVFFCFAAFKNHIWIYPPVKGDRRLKLDREPYRGDKGNLRFPLSEPMPYDLISRVAKALWEESTTW